METAITIGFGLIFGLVAGLFIGASSMAEESEKSMRELLEERVEDLKEIEDLKQLRKMNEKTITNLSKDNFNKAGKIRAIKNILNQQNYGSTENLINKIKSVLDEPEKFI